MHMAYDMTLVKSSDLFTTTYTVSEDNYDIQIEAKNDKV